MLGSLPGLVDRAVKVPSPPLSHPATIDVVPTLLDQFAFSYPLAFALSGIFRLQNASKNNNMQIELITTIY